MNRKTEQAALRTLTTFIQSDMAEVSSLVVAGALMRLSTEISIAVFGPQRGAKAARNALNNILDTGRTIQ